MPNPSKKWHFLLGIAPSVEMLVNSLTDDIHNKL